MEYFLSACVRIYVRMCPQVSAYVRKKCGQSASCHHPIRIPLLGTFTQDISTNDRSRMSTGGRTVCSHSSGRTGSGRSTGSYSRGSQATAPSAVTSPRGRGSPVSTGQILKTQAPLNPAINNRFLGRKVRQKCT